MVIRGGGRGRRNWTKAVSQKAQPSGNSLEIQWLGLYTSTAEDPWCGDEDPESCGAWTKTEVIKSQLLGV